MTLMSTHYPDPTRIEPVNRHTLAVVVDNEPGVLARIAGMFSGRGYNIESLTVTETEHEAHISRITIVTTGTNAVIEQIKSQLERLVPVHRVVDLTLRARRSSASCASSRWSARASTGSRRCASPPRSARRTLDATLTSFVYELTGTTEEVERFIKPDDGGRPRRGLAHRDRRHGARPGGDVRSRAIVYRRRSGGWRLEAAGLDARFAR